MKRNLLLVFLLFVSTLICYGQSSTESKNEQIGLSLQELFDNGYITQEEFDSTKGSNDKNQPSANNRADCSDAYIPKDDTYIPVPRNDDGSLYIPDMGFTFSFCGSTYSDCFINTNGNISFTQAVAQFSPDGFPYAVPMIAPFWADVDTRNVACEQAYYKLFGNYMIVTWEEVGWFSNNCDPLNTFQVIISDGTAPIVGVGSNIQFRYGDMEWTTGTASGGGPFGGFAATVGYNAGDDINFEQVGRFNLDGNAYDGPFGDNDGVDFLDNNCFVFNAGTGSVDLTCMDIDRALDANCSVTITAEDVSDFIVNGCAEGTISLDITDFGCDDVGDNIVTITVDDGSGNEETCTAIVTITSGACNVASINQVGPYCDNDGPVILSATPPGGTWDGNAPGGIFDPSAGPGFYDVTYTNPAACPPTATITIEVFDAPEVTINPDPAQFCEEVGFIDLFASGTGGDGNYMFTWDTPDGPMSGDIIVGFNEGQYTVTISDGNVCEDIVDVVVTMNPTPLITIDDPGPICEEILFVNIQALPAGGVWSGTEITPAGDVFPTTMDPGFYTVTYTYSDGFGCTAAESFDLEIVPGPIAIAVNSGPYCDGQVISLFGDSTEPGSSFEWSGPNGYTSLEQNPTDAIEAGFYILTVTSPSGCVSPEEITIVELAPGPDSDASNTGPYCAGEPIELFASTSVGGTIFYQWTGPNAYTSTEEVPLDATEPGLYTVIITVDGCDSPEAFTEVVITPAPDATAFNTGPYCADDEIQLFSTTNTPGGTFTYEWTGPNTYLSFDQNPTDATEPGIYSVQITVDGCLADLQNTEVIFNQIVPPSITGDPFYCEGETTMLDAGSAYNEYLWSNGDVTQMTTITEPGGYTVLVTNLAGCTAEAIVVVDENPSPMPFISGSSTFCSGSFSVLDAGTGYSGYIWSNGEMTQNITASLPGDYSVTVTDGNGCTGENLITVTENSSLLPAIAGEPNYCEGESTLLDAGVFSTYMWTGGGQDQFLNVTSPGIYGVTVSDDTGCTGEASIVIAENALPLVTIVGGVAICEGESTLLGTDGVYEEYSWSNGTSGENITVETSGAYGVTVTNIGGCTAENTIDVTVNPPPTVVVSGVTSFCEGGSTFVDAGAGFANYAWSNGTSNQILDISEPGIYTVTVTDGNNCTAEDIVDIVENSSLVPQIEGTLVFCDGESSLLDAGTGYETYVWNQGSSSQTITVEATGEYIVTVSDASGCTGEVAVTVTENTLPQVNIDGIAAICDGASTELSADGIFDNYEWSTGTTDASIIVDASGTYTLMVTDNNNCTAEASLDVTLNANPEPGIDGSTSFCAGSSTSLDAGAGYDTYVWSNGSTEQIVIADAANTFTVTVTNESGCTGEATTTVEESASLNPVILGELVFCEGESSILDAGTGYETYTWNQGSSSQTITVEATGEYIVTVADASGCTGEVAVAIIENILPQVNIDGIVAICDGASTELSADGIFDNYEWSTGTTGNSITVDAAGTYTLLVTDNNSCTAEASINIALNANPEPVIAGSTTFCSGSSASLDAGAGYDTYAWSNGSIEQIVIADAANTFTVTVTNESGCTGEATTTVEESSSLNPVISGELSFCEGGNSLLNAGAGFDTYNWSNGAGTQTVLAEAPGQYDVTVTDNSGCTGETSIVIVENNPPTIAILGNTPVCEGETVTLDAGGGFSEYLWSDASLNQSLEIAASGTYGVTVTDNNGCTAEETIEAVINENPEPVILGTTTFCTGSEITLALNENFDSYEWSDGSETASIVVNTGGDYSVVVSLASGCSAAAQISVTENDSLEPTIDGDLSFCEGASTTLIAPPGFIYEWSNSMSTQEVVVTTTGQYSVLVTDATGCTGMTQVDVISNGLPEPIIAGSTTFCTGTSAILDAGDYTTYLWSNGESTQTLEVSTENTYSVVVTDANGCTGEALIDVTESTSLNPAISGDLSLCEGSTSTLDAGAGFETYFWSTGEATQSISTTTPGEYTVTVSDLSGCTGDGTVALVVNSNPTTTISGVDVFCGNDNTILDAGTGYAEYLWTNGATTQTIEATLTGNYGVLITDNNGCTAEANLEVTQNQNPIVDILGPTSFCSGNAASLTLNGTYTNYQWSTGESTPSIDLTTGMDVSVIVTDGNGCTGESSITVTENTELTPAITGTLSFCEGANTLLDVGAGWETYQWSTGDDTSNINVTDAGNYEVIIFDASGCSGSATVTVATTPNPEPIIAGSTTFCTGNTATLDAGTYSSWAWSTGDASQTIVTNQTGNYEVTVTDENGCIGIAETMITESSSLNPVISGIPAFCEGENTLLDVGAGFETYAWSNGSSGQSLEVSTTGDYAVTVTDTGGCTGETTIAVNVVDLPTATLQNAEICNTELSGSLLNLYDLVIGGDTNGTWVDADGSGASGLFNNINFDGVTPGDYNFTYTTNSAVTPCPEVSYPIVITVLDCACGGFSFLPVSPLCNSDAQLELSSTISTTEPGTWSLISVPTGMNPAVLTGTDFNATGADQGEYTLQYQFTNTQADNCPTVFTQVIIVDQEVNAGVANAPIDLCQEEASLIDLGDMLTGEDVNGTWTEISTNSSQGTAFDPSTGNFNTASQIPGTYTFQYEVGGGTACPAENVAVDIIINEQPLAVAGDPIELTCGEPMNSLDASGSSQGVAYEISWIGLGVVMDGNEETLTPTVSASGSYELVITNVLTGCTASDVVVVTESADVPVALAGLDQELTCTNTTTVLQPGQNYGSDYLIEWTGPGITVDNMNELNPEVGIEGTYTLQVTSLANGCTSSPDIVEVIPNNFPPEVIINTPLSSLDCDVTAVELIISAPGTALVYEWADAAGNILGNNSTLSNIETEGLYTVFVMNTATGCSATETLEVVDNVSYPIVNAIEPIILDCNNLTTILDGTGSQIGADMIYNWTGPGLSGAPSDLISEANAPGTYTLQVTDSSNGCPSEVSIVVNQDIATPIATIDNPEELDCTVLEVSLNGAGSSSGLNIDYQWLDPDAIALGSTTEQLVTNAGVYQFVVTDNDNGCSAVATTTVSQNENLPEAALLDLRMPDCFGESTGGVLIEEIEGGTPPYVYSFNGSTYANDNFYPNLTAGTYDLSLEDANGCEWSTTVTITEPDSIGFDLEFDLGEDLILSLGDSAIINAETNLAPNQIDTIIWTSEYGYNCESTDCSSISVQTYNSSFVTAEVVDVTGCKAVADIRVLVDIDRKVYIPSAFSPNGDSVNDVFKIYSDEKQIKQINYLYVYNRWGEVVFEYVDFDPSDERISWDGTFRGLMMNPGVYVYMAEIEFIDGFVGFYKGDVTLFR